MSIAKKTMLYRLAIDGIGIYEAYKNILFRRYPFDVAKTLWKGIVDASSWLPKPHVDDYSKDLVSWFTEAGLEMFKKTVFRKMSMEIEYEDIDFYKKPLEDCECIVYQDEWQIVEKISLSRDERAEDE